MLDLYLAAFYLVFIFSLLNLVVTLFIPLSRHSISLLNLLIFICSCCSLYLATVSHLSNIVIVFLYGLSFLCFPSILPELIHSQWILGLCSICVIIWYFDPWVNYLVYLVYVVPIWWYYQEHGFPLPSWFVCIVRSLSSPDTTIYTCYMMENNILTQ